VLATEPVVKAEASKVTVAVATVVIFGTMAIFLYPAMYRCWRTGLPGSLRHLYGFHHA
jgi:uncharacterized membrane protein YadS